MIAKNSGRHRSTGINISYPANAVAVVFSVYLSAEAVFDSNRDRNEGELDEALCTQKFGISEFQQKAPKSLQSQPK